MKGPRGKKKERGADEGGGTPNPAGVATARPYPRTPETTNADRTDTGSPVGASIRVDTHGEP